MVAVVLAPVPVAPVVETVNEAGILAAPLAMVAVAAACTEPAANDKA